MHQRRGSLPGQTKGVNIPSNNDKMMEHDFNANASNNFGPPLKTLLGRKNAMIRPDSPPSDNKPRKNKSFSPSGNKTSNQQKEETKEFEMKEIP